MKFLAEKTDGGRKKGKIALYCRVLEVSRQGFYRYLSRRERPWKYQRLMSSPVIKCKKTPRKKCSLVAEVKGKR